MTEKYSGVEREAIDVIPAGVPSPDTKVEWSHADHFAKKMMKAAEDMVRAVQAKDLKKAMDGSTVMKTNLKAMRNELGYLEK